MATYLTVLWAFILFSYVRANPIDASTQEEQTLQFRQAKQYFRENLEALSDVMTPTDKEKFQKHYNRVSCMVAPYYEVDEKMVLSDDDNDDNHCVRDDDSDNVYEEGSGEPGEGWPSLDSGWLDSDEGEENSDFDDGSKSEDGDDDDNSGENEQNGGDENHSRNDHDGEEDDTNDNEDGDRADEGDDDDHDVDDDTKDDPCHCRDLLEILNNYVTKHLPDSNNYPWVSNTNDIIGM